MAPQYNSYYKKYYIEELINRKKGLVVSLFVLGCSLGCLNKIFPKLKDLCNSWIPWIHVKKNESRSSFDEQSYIYIKENSIDYNLSNELQKINNIKSRINSKHQKIRHNAVTELSQANQLHNAHCLQIGYSCNMKTLVGLARNKGTNIHFFQPPPPIEILRKTAIYEECCRNKHDCDFLDEFRLFLAALPSHKSNDCLDFFTKQAMKYKLHSDDVEGAWLEETHVPSSRSRSKANNLSLKYCLQALLRHAYLSESHQSILKNGGLQLLTKFYIQYKENEELMCLISRIIHVFTALSEFHPLLHQGGWLRILYEWCSSSNVKLSSIAASSLANLDADKYGPAVIYNDGIYLLHPQNRSSKSHDADVIFVHGLKGSAFRTWRQKDKIAADANKVPATHEQTKCWPRDWLGKDVPNLRILAVDYESELTERGRQCPLENDKCSLQRRSDELSNKLIAAGVGSRPIIWVSHSMGGLLIKQMLVSAVEAPADSDNRKLLHASAGIAFYSVPHLGTSIASKLNQQTQYLFSLSPEVKELQKESSKLLELNDKFKNILKEKQIPILNFGETLKTSFGLKIQAFIVDRQSADIGIGEFIDIAANHLNTCKPIDTSSEIYTRLLEFIYLILPSHDGHESIFHHHAKSERDYFILAHGQ